MSIENGAPVSLSIHWIHFFIALIRIARTLGSVFRFSHFRSIALVMDSLHSDLEGGSPHWIMYIQSSRRLRQHASTVIIPVEPRVGRQYGVDKFYDTTMSPLVHIMSNALSVGSPVNCVEGRGRPIVSHSKMCPEWLSRCVISHCRFVVACDRSSLKFQKVPPTL